ncbi:MAG: tetratricopeptide repeat protein [Alphaproteobacteria bacterium]|nr:tetratricopeptide repeat protein [Alphaproteobacteria bacterium]
MGYDILFQQALKLHEDGRLIEAEKIYRKILETTPNNPDILNLLGLIAQAQGIHGEAVTLFYQAIKQISTHAPFHYNLAISLQAWGKPYEAIDAFLQALKFQPAIPEAYLNIANIYLSLGKRTEAIENFQKALQIAPDYAEAKANICFLKKDIEQLEALKGQYSMEASIYYFLAKLYQQKNIQKAYQNIEKANELCQNSDLILFEKAYLDLLLEHSQKAKATFESVIKLNPNHLEALINLGLLEAEEKNFQKAEELYKKAIRLDNQNLAAHLNYATLLYQQKRLHEALEEYRQAVILQPEMPEASNNIALILRDLGEFEEALGLFFNAFNKAPQQAEFGLNIIETLYLLVQSNKKEEALKIAENWLKSYPDNLFSKQAFAALSGQEIASNETYNNILFDNFAERYEETLKNIEYNLINKIKELNLNVNGKVIDLGCGTGLLGESIKTSENEFIGIDLSQNMLTLAAEKNVYDELIKTDALSYLKENKDFDWLFALDVFNYIGDVSEILKQCQNKKICFSIEILENSEKDYTLSESGRYLHNSQYIENLLESLGFPTIEKMILNLRTENGEDVKGCLYYSAFLKN